LGGQDRASRYSQSTSKIQEEAFTKTLHRGGWDHGISKGIRYGPLNRKMLFSPWAAAPGQSGRINVGNSTEQSACSRFRIGEAAKPRGLFAVQLSCLPSN
jgi:hypothetical protein